MSSPLIEIAVDATMQPLTKLVHASKGALGQFDGGVYYSDGTLCELGSTRKGSYQNIAAEFQAPSEKISGRKHIYGGMLQNTHFGHFLAESLARLWAIKHLSADFETVVFYPRIPGKGIPAYAKELLSLISSSHSFELIDAPKTFEMLAVPSQIGHQRMGFLEGHPSVRWMLKPLQTMGEPQGRKLYVSRSRMKPYEGGILFENRIEDLLREEGYEIIHPQELSISRQIELYNSSSHIIFSEGSALHLYALVTKTEQKVFVIWRRKLSPIFNWQIASFGGQKIMGSPVIRRLFVPKIAYGSLVRAKADLSFSELHYQLASSGFLRGTAWTDPSCSEIEDAVSGLTTLNKTPYEAIMI